MDQDFLNAIKNAKKDTKIACFGNFEKFQKVKTFTQYLKFTT